MNQSVVSSERSESRDLSDCVRCFPKVSCTQPARSLRSLAALLGRDDTRDTRVCSSLVVNFDPTAREHHGLPRGDPQNVARGVSPWNRRRVATSAHRDRQARRAGRLRRSLLILSPQIRLVTLPSDRRGTSMAASRRLAGEVTRSLTGACSRERPDRGRRRARRAAEGISFCDDSPVIRHSRTQPRGRERAAERSDDDDLTICGEHRHLTPQNLPGRANVHTNHFRSRMSARARPALHAAKAAPPRHRPACTNEV
jgi:hypothetical protein